MLAHDSVYYLTVVQQGEHFSKNRTIVRRDLYDN